VAASIRVCDQAREWLYRSVPLEGNNLPIITPLALPAPRFETLRVEGRSLRVELRRIDVKGKPYTVQVVAPMHEAFEALERFRMLLLFAAPLLLIAASAGVCWLSTRALAPVGEISPTAQRITIENLADRLPVSHTGDQLQRLLETLNDMFGSGPHWLILYLANLDRECIALGTNRRFAVYFTALSIEDEQGAARGVAIPLDWHCPVPQSGTEL
jgi:hypothetical protein